MNMNLSGTFKALSEPIRLRISVLLTTGELCVCNLVDILGLPQSTISRHLAILKSNQIVNDRRNGKWIYYSLNKQETEITIEINKLLKMLVNEKPYCDDMLKLSELNNLNNC